MPTLAFQLFGLSEFWPGVLTVVLIVIGLLWLMFSTDFGEHAPWPFHKSDSFGEDQYTDERERRITHGVLICDWVDGTVLATVAKQKAVEPEPDRTERGEASTSGGSIEGGPRRGWLKGRLSWANSESGRCVEAAVAVELSS